MPILHQSCHWNHFVSIPPLAVKPSQIVPAVWVNKLGLAGATTNSQLPTAFVNRKWLHETCKDPAVPVLDAYLCVMAWGGQSDSHAIAAWTHRQSLIPVLTQLREGGLSGLRAYKLFTTGKTSKFSGLGPSYFTKLIHFFSPGDHLYIVDNYVLASLEILTGLPHQFRATPGGYVAACWEIDEMSRILGSSGADTEARLFSGRSQPWRNYANKQPMSKPGNAGYRKQMSSVYSAAVPMVEVGEFW